MRISNLPVAKNNVSYLSSLKQHQMTEHKVISQSQGTTDQAVFTKSLISSDNSYTKHDALLKQWNKEGSFNLYDVLNGGKVNLQNPNPSLEELQSLEQKLQQNGIGTEIDWNDFEFDLKGIGFDIKYPTFYLKPEAFNQKTDYLASRYAAMKDRIEKNFSGEEAIQQLNHLNALYQSATEILAKSYSEVVGGFLEQNGLVGEKEKIYQSVIDGVSKKATEYEEYLSSNSELEKLKGTKDEWLLQDDEYVASLLRGKDVENVSGESTKLDHYTQKDLDILGKYVSGLTKWEDSTLNMDEERIGLDFAMLSMRTENLRKENKISASLENVLNRMLDGFMSHALDRLDNKLSDLRDRGAALKDKSGYAQLDRQAIWNVYNKTMDYYKTSGNIKESYLYGAKFAANQSLQKSGNDTYRHMNNEMYWTQFFDRNHNNPYDTGMSTYENAISNLIDKKV